MKNSSIQLIMKLFIKDLVFLDEKQNKHYTAKRFYFLKSEFSESYFNDLSYQVSKYNIDLSYRIQPHTKAQLKVILTFIIKE